MCSFATESKHLNGILRLPESLLVGQNNNTGPDFKLALLSLSVSSVPASFATIVDASVDPKTSHLDF
jgi:hypothetical protein